MSNILIATTSIDIQASAEKVWEGLTNPEIIKKYFFGTDASSDWKIGSPIIFSGEWEGKKYQDKGTILDIEECSFVTYDYWSSMSGTEDLPEHYSTITYRLTPHGDHTTLTITQEGFASKEAQEHSASNWQHVFEGLKKLLEAK